MHRESLKPIYFSCGPSKKFKDWNSNIFQNEWINRSHIYDFKKYISNCLNKIKALLNLPSDYEILFVPGSGSGAIWCGFLNCLVPNSHVQVSVSGYFSQIWYSELNKEFGNFGIKADFIKYDDDFNLSDIDCKKDYIITAVDTANGVRNLNVPDNMEGLVLMDAMTAIFLENLEWQKLDVIAFAMQKILGGDGSLGALILSPKALKRLEIAKPWPIPRTFNINEWKLENVVNGTFMSTPSILALIELNSILDWVDQKGGLTFLQTKNAENWAVIEECLSKNDQFEYTIKNADHRAKAVACIGLKKWQNEHISLQEKMEEMKDIAQKAEKLKVYDICNFYIPSWRFWAGPMQEADDIKIGLERFINIFKP